jgi:NADPH:quinone reductase-like Zn-dependent oxidoreductase
MRCHLMFRRSGLLPGSPRVPFTLGVDVVGVVDNLGRDVSTVQAGQIVAGATFYRVGLGGYAEYICLPTSELAPVSSGVDPAEAVCLAANHMTAYAALHQAAKVRSGERILFHGAAGGVGTALLDLGWLAGLEMYGTASKHNHCFVSKLGATPIDYRTEDFVERIRNLTGGGVDAVFDPIGSARQIWRSHRTLRKGRRLVWFGVAAVKKDGLQVIPLTLLTLGLLDSFRAAGRFGACQNSGRTMPGTAKHYRNSSICWRQAESSRWWRTVFHWSRPLALTSYSSAACTRARWFSLPARSQGLRIRTVGRRSQVNTPGQNGRCR